MNAYIKKLIWKLISIPFQRAVNWSQDDKAVFESFCRTQTGLKFLELLRQLTAATTFKAVYRDTVSAECGRAKGMQDLLAAIHRLRSFPPEESVPSQDEDVEPLPSQQTGFDGRRFSFPGGNSAIRNQSY